MSQLIVNSCLFSEPWTRAGLKVRQSAHFLYARLASPAGNKAYQPGTRVKTKPPTAVAIASLDTGPLPAGIQHVLHGTAAGEDRRQLPATHPLQPCLSSTRFGSHCPGWRSHRGSGLPWTMGGACWIAQAWGSGGYKCNSRVARTFFKSVLMVAACR